MRLRRIKVTGLESGTKYADVVVQCDGGMRKISTDHVMAAIKNALDVGENSMSGSDNPSGYHIEITSEYR